MRPRGRHVSGALAALGLLLGGGRAIGAPGPEARLRALLAEPPSFAPVFLGGGRPGASEPRRPPMRIVTVAPSATELIFALGAGARVVAVSRFDEEPPEVRALPKVGGFIDPNAEAILAARPELVVGVPNAGARPVLERVAALGVPVLIVPGNTFADIQHAARALGPVLGDGAEERAEALVVALERDLGALAREVADRPAPKVAFVYGWTPLVLAGPGSFADALLSVLGGENLVTRGPQYPQYSLERLIEDGPEVIIDASGIHTAARGELWARFASLPAVRAGRVHEVRAQDVLVPGPRIVAGARRIAALLHPPPAARAP